MKSFSAFCAGLCIAAAAVNTNAQDQSGKLKQWRFGAHAGVSANFIGVGYQDFRTLGMGTNFEEKVINDASSFVPYFGLNGEYISGNWWNIMFRASYDNRSGKIEDEKTPGSKSMEPSIAYLSLEPALRVNLTQEFNVYGGPMFALNLQKSLGKIGGADVAGDIPNFNGFSMGLWAGFSYDILLNDRLSTWHQYLTPFVEVSWLTNQKKVEFNVNQDALDDIWSTVSVRAGAAFKLGRAESVSELAVNPDSPDLNVSLFPPDELSGKRSVDEFFPLLNYVYFDPASSNIPSRYVQIAKSDAASFSENSFIDEQEPRPGEPIESYADRQLRVYRNVMNIIGSRMRSTTDTITLVGSAPVEKDGDVIASYVKDYLVNTFGIDGSRIRVTSDNSPKDATATRSKETRDQEFAGVENRRVKFVSSNSAILKPVELKYKSVDPVENELEMNVSASKDIESWKVSVTGPGGIAKEYGPFKKENQFINATSLMSGSTTAGRYVATVVARGSDGAILNKTKEFDLKVSPEKKLSAYRYGVIYKFGETDAVKVYEDFLRKEVAPRVTTAADIFISGYADVIGDEKVNNRISKQRADEIKDILQDELRKLGRRVTLKVYNFGEDEARSPFTNGIPEGRAYNRTSIIEVVPR
jgi:outer membrane protein OmpA-like peptidoglycan-associated protein